MRLLLDTHSFLWFIMGERRLSGSARAHIEDTGNERLLSVASLWEMAIKVSLGKLTLAEPFDALVPNQLRANDVRVLGITLGHVTVVASLPFHHRDPFDRLLVAQAMLEQVPLVSADPAFDRYPVQRLW